MIKDLSCAQTSIDSYSRESPTFNMKTNSLNPYLLRSPFQSQELHFSKPVQRVFETVLLNSQIKEMPQTKEEYIQLLITVQNDTTLKQLNVASFLRTVADVIAKDNRLYQMIIKKLGFCPERRLFQNSAIFNQANGGDVQTYLEEIDESKKDIGLVTFYDFLIKLGQLQSILPESQEKLETLFKEAQKILSTHRNKSQQLLNDKENNQYLDNQNTSEFTLLKNPLMQAIVSDEDDYHSQQIQTHEMMLQDLQNSLQQKEAQRQIQSSLEERLKENNNESENNNDLEAEETLEINQGPIIHYNPFPQKPQAIKQSKEISKDIYQFLQNLSAGPKCATQERRTLNGQNININNPNPQYSFMNSLRQSKPQQSNNNKFGNTISGDQFNYSAFTSRKPGESVISATNSYFNTPLHTKSNNIYNSQSEVKLSSSRNIMFAQLHNNQHNSHDDNNKLESSPQQSFHYLNGLSNGQQNNYQNFNMQQMQSQGLPNKNINPQYFTPLGKRNGGAFQDLDDGAFNLKNMTSPSHLAKRQRLNGNGLYHEKESDSSGAESDEEGQNQLNEDPNNSASRKKRGLKILSVKVQELVYKKQKTTYKDVANELIEQLKKNSEMQELTGLGGEISDREEDDEESSQDNKSPSKKKKSTSSHHQSGDKSSQLQKWEKNVRRRVYDALNVLYAAGVLKKENKHVSCDSKAMQLTHRLKESAMAAQHEEQLQQSQRQLMQGQQSESRFMHSIELLRQQVEQQKSRVDEKRELLADKVKHYLSYKQLIKRNQQLEEIGRVNKQRTINLPFILVSTKDSPDNEVDITYGENLTMLNIAMKKPLTCYGDADTLMMLKMYKVDQQFYQDAVPKANEVMKFLTEFERELKAKLQQKSTQFSTEEATLLKAFKYFDLDNNGTCEPSEFAKALEKIGVVVGNKRDLETLFKYYDTDGSGALDYKEFTAILLGGSQDKPERKSAQYGSGVGYKQTPSGQANVNELIEKVRVKLASRGARGMIGMGKQFKIFDDNNSRSLDQYEFKKAMTEQRLQLSDQDIITLFNTFDRNRDGTIDYDEFVRVLRGPMNNFRKKLVLQAFNKIDKDGSGFVDISDIKDVYNAKRHPDVIQGKKTEEDILLEFLETFETHHNICNSTAPDHIVTKEEFEEYYNNISSSIDNDQYFELMINNAWKINEGDRTYGKGWSDQETAGGKSLGQAYGQRPQTASQQQRPKPTDNRFQTSNTGYGQTGNPKGSTSTMSQRASQQSTQGIEAAFNKLRQRLASRGARGFIGLQKQFKIMDDDNSGNIDQSEFRKAIKDFRIDLNEQEIKDVFRGFDRDGSGTIDYDEFVRGVRGPMNTFRQNIVKAAFKKLDKDGSGVIDLNDIRGVYSAKTHPDVKSGKKTEDEVLGEFLETFEMHHSLNGGGIRDRTVTIEEFLEYYNNVSASIDNDQYFELMMINAWKLLGEASRKPAWTNVNKEAGNQLYKNGFNVTRGAPFGVDNDPTDYSTNLRPRTAAQSYQTQPAAGSSSFQMRNNETITGAPKGQNPSGPVSYSDRQLLEVFSQKLASRGARGIIGLQKQFKIVDDDRSHDLDMYEFRKAIKDFRVPVTDKDIERLFSIFDRDRSGKIDYDEFLRGVRGEMNGFRRGLCEKAFKIMDKDRSGVLNIDDIKGVYNGKMHPDVKAGKKTEDEVLGEFLDTFEMHYSLNHENSKDRQISLDEWMEYYNNVSMSIDDDKYFELMMNSAWNLDNSRVTKKGWGGEF